jgi:hypothetical protein
MWGDVAFFLFPLPIEWAMNWVVYMILPFLDVPPVPLERWGDDDVYASI